MSALSDYRNFTRATVAGFDGSTAETAVYTQTRNVFATPTDTLVGSFSPASLNRVNIASVARVMLQGTVVLGDVIRVRDSSGGIRFTRPASVESSGWFFLGPEDVLEIVSAGATSADILINDLTDPQLQEWILSEITQSGSSVVPTSDYSEITIVASGAVPAWTGRLMAFLDLGGLGNNVILPPLADVALGDSVTFLRVPGSALPVIQVDNVGADLVNDLLGATANEYYLRDAAQSITYTRVTGGWQRAAGAPVQGKVTAAAGPFNIPAFQQGTLYVDDVIGAPGAVVNLPLLADCTEGVRIVITSSRFVVPPGQVHVLTAAGADTINTLSTIFLYSSSNTTSVVVAEHAGDTWAVHSNVSEVINGSNSLVAAGSISARGGVQVLELALAADGDVVLPDPATLPRGTVLKLFQAGPGIPRIIPDNALTEVNGLAGLVANEYYLRSAGDSVSYVLVGGGWLREFGEQAPPAATANANPFSVPAWTGGTSYLFDTTVVLDNQTNLPATGSCRPGVRLVVRNYDTQRHQVHPFAGDFINGASIWYIQPGETASFEVADTTQWLAIGGGTQNTPTTSAFDVTFSPFIGEQYVKTTGGAGQNVTLPDYTQIGVGTKVYMYNASGNAHTLSAFAGQFVLGAGFGVIPPNSGFVVYWDGDTTLGWKGWATP
jgi:hypothetical protein